MTQVKTAQLETAEEFLQGYAARARMTVDQVLFERKIVPCDPATCGYEGCTGWRAELIVVDVTTVDEPQVPCERCGAPSHWVFVPVDAGSPRIRACSKGCAEIVLYKTSRASRPASR
jgi:hypothetical protein